MCVCVFGFRTSATVAVVFVRADPAADEEELLQLLNQQENSANAGNVSADIAANTMAAADQAEVDAASAAFLADEINGPQQSVGTGPGPGPDPDLGSSSSDGDSDENADDDEPRSVYKAATGLVVECAKSKRIVRFKSRKDSSVFLAKEACEFEHGKCRGRAGGGIWRGDLRTRNPRDSKLSCDIYIYDIYHITSRK
eukprot:COSAG02_NODE_3882_length_6090_cov_26.657152_3_plen_197_part_00